MTREVRLHLDATAELDLRRASGLCARRPHIHRREDETFYILEGECRLLLADEWITAGAGDFINVPRGTVHRFHNQSTETMRMILTFTPAAIENFFQETLQPTLDPTADIPDNYDAVAARNAAPHVRHPAGRLRALRANPDVAVMIDTETFPPEVLTLRGRVQIREVEGIPAEYASAARRYLGVEAADEYFAQIDRPGTRMAVIELRPMLVRRRPARRSAVAAAAVRRPRG